MPETTKSRPEPMLSLDELAPVVDLVGCYHFKKGVGFDYQVPSHHLILIARGTLRARTPHGSFTAKRGDLVCFRPAEANHYSVSDDTLFYQMQVQFAPPPKHRMTPCFRGLGPLPLRMALGAGFHEARGCFETLCLCITSGGDAAHLRLRAAVCSLLALAAQIHDGRDKTSATEADPFLRARQRIEGSLSKPVSIDALAVELSVSTAWFIREFKRRFDITPKACHTHARLREAARRLRHGGESIKAIAFSLGFNDPKTFARRFKHHHGLNPGQLTTTEALPRAERASKKQKGLFPLNQHLLPPSEHPANFKVYLPQTPLTATERRRVLDKLKHPANYA